MRVGMYSPYLSTMGGGERYFFSVAQFFLRRGDSVEIFSDPIDLSNLSSRFSLDLKGVRFTENIFVGNLLHKLQQTAKYDLIFFLSDGSLPFTFAKKNIIHFQTPFVRPLKSLINSLKLLNITSVVCNSEFTKLVIDKSYGVQSLVLYPPVDVNTFSVGEKQNIILSVGRFCSPSHPKKQHEMINYFRELVKTGVKGWKLVLIGGVTGDSTDEVKKLVEESKDLPVEIITDAKFPILKEFYSKAKIYWHAAGVNEDLVFHPDRAEHFGITTVEAMASGCVPIVFNGGGQREIIENGVNGFLWNNKDELIEQTNSLISDSSLLKKMSVNAIGRSKKFSKEEFFKHLEEIINNVH